MQAHAYIVIVLLFLFSLFYCASIFLNIKRLFFFIQDCLKPVYLLLNPKTVNNNTGTRYILALDQFKNALRSLPTIAVIICVYYNAKRCTFGTTILVSFLILVFDVRNSHRFNEHGLTFKYLMWLLINKHTFYYFIMN